MASILGKRLDGLTHSYPSALDEVRDPFDLTIIRDLEEREGSTVPARTELDYALGAPEDLTAGVRRHQMTPSFCSVAELNAFCERHLKWFREMLMPPSRSRDSWGRSWPATSESEGNGLKAGRDDTGRIPGCPECANWSTLNAEMFATYFVSVK